jgi:hypothetical protein
MADVNFNLANPYQTQLDELARRQKMAEIMQQQSFQPTERFSYAGIEAPISPLAGLTKALQGYMGGKAQRDIAEEKGRLSEDYKTQSAQQGEDFVRALQGTPAQVEIPIPQGGEGIGPGRPAMPAKGPDMAKALQLSMSSVNPMVQGAGGAMLTQMLKPIEGAFGKVDPKDYTPASVKLFATGGGKDFSVLVPVRKQEMATTVGPTGQTVQKPYDPYAPPVEGFIQPMTGFVGTLQQLGMLTPDMMKNPKVQEVLSGYIGKETGQVTPAESAKIGIQLANLKNEGLKTQYEAGGGTGSPVNVPTFNLFNQQPVAQPNAAITPAVQPPTRIAPQGTARPATQPTSAPASAGNNTASAQVVAQSLNNRPIPQKLLDQAAVEKIKSTGANENTLRDEYNTLTKDFRVVQDAHEKIKNVASTGAGDMSLLYSFIKLLDPGSVVRESEFAAAAASGSFGERVQGAMQRVLTGQRLSDNLRNDFIREADNLYTSQKRGTDRLTESYTGIAKRMGLNPGNIIVDYVSKTGAAKPNDPLGIRN